ncbi:MAG: acetylglutamate kinase [Ekhidna sp.]
MKEKLSIVKVGGAVVEDEVKLADFLDAFSKIKGLKLLIHGGGKVATKLANSLGIDSKLVDGRRVTDDEMIDVVIMTYGGLINKKIVAQLNARGMNSVGLTGADADCMRSRKRPVKNGLNYGWVGDVEYINDRYLKQLISNDIIPVMAPLTHDGKGHLLNTNADTIAKELACALVQDFDVSLNFIFDLNGVLENVNDPNTLIKSIDREKYKSLKANGTVSGGMIPKLDNAFETIDKGVSLVRLLNVHSLSQITNSNFDEYTIFH